MKRFRPRSPPSSFGEGAHSRSPAKRNPTVKPPSLSRKLSRETWSLSLLLVAGTFIAYIPAQRAGIIWDDRSLVIDNPLVHRPDGLLQIWFSRLPVDFYPVTSSMHWMEWRLWGENPAGYHCVNILLHALSSVLVWRVLRRLAVPGAWIASALFAVHPVNVESVAWIAQGKNTLAMFFYLLSVLCYLRFDGASPPSNAGERAERASKRRSEGVDTQSSGPIIAHTWYALSIVAFILALLSKTAVAPMPFLLLGLAWWRTGRLRRANLLQSAPFFVAAFVVGAISHWFQIHRAIGEDVVRTDGLGARLAGAGWAIWFYLYKTVLPFGLMPIYPRWHIDQARWWNYLPVAALAVVLAAFVRYPQGWRRRGLAGLGYFIVMLLPVLGFLDIAFMQQSFVADHWQYFAIIGPIAIVASALGSVTSIGTPGLLAACVALPSVLGVLTWRQCEVYVDAGTFWRHQLAGDEGSWLAHNNLGTFLVERGQPEEAMVQFEDALRIQPNNATVYYNLGGALRQQGRAAEAIKRFQEAVAIQPNYSMAHCNLGELLYDTGRVGEAVAHFRSAIQIQPSYAEAHVGLARALSEQNKADDAISQLREAMSLAPNEAEIHNDLGNVFRQKGELDEALKEYRTALQMRPDDAIANYNLGGVLYQEGRVREAIGQYRKALEIRGDFAPACNALSWVLATAPDPSLRDGSRAVELAEELERLSGGKNPRYEETVAAAYAESRRFNKALERAQWALRLAESANREALVNRLKRQIALYQSGTPYREESSAGN